MVILHPRRTDRAGTFVLTPSWASAGKPAAAVVRRGSRKAFLLHWRPMAHGDPLLPGPFLRSAGISGMLLADGPMPGFVNRSSPMTLRPGPYASDIYCRLCCASGGFPAEFFSAPLTYLFPSALVSPAFSGGSISPWKRDGEKTGETKDQRKDQRYDANTNVKGKR